MFYEKLGPRVAALSSRLPTGAAEETPRELDVLQRNQGSPRTRDIYARPGARLPRAGLSLFISQAWGSEEDDFAQPAQACLCPPPSRKCHSGFAEAGNTHTEWTRQIHLLAGVIPESGCRHCLKHPHPPEPLFVQSDDDFPTPPVSLDWGHMIERCQMPPCPPQSLPWPLPGRAPTPGRTRAGPSTMKPLPKRSDPGLHAGGQCLGAQP